MRHSARRARRWKGLLAKARWADYGSVTGTQDGFTSEADHLVICPRPARTAMPALRRASPPHRWHRGIVPTKVRSPARIASCGCSVPTPRNNIPELDPRWFTFTMPALLW